LPSIRVSDRELRDISTEAMDAVRLANDPPTIFQRIGTLTRVRQNDKGLPVLESLSEAALRGRLTRTANWWRVTRQGPVAVSPPLDVVRDLLALGEWSGLPHLQGVVEAPTFAPDGTLLTEPGYHPAARLWFHRAPGFSMPAITLEPSAAEVGAARELLLSELLGEFPFEDDASRAHV